MYLCVRLSLSLFLCVCKREKKKESEGGKDKNIYILYFVGCNATWENAKPSAWVKKDRERKTVN